VKRILIVCKGNICRSPTAEIVLETKARAIGLDIKVDSAGTENYHVGDSPDTRSIRHAAKRGYDLSKKEHDRFSWQTLSYTILFGRQIMRTSRF
jgi:protein-tyrosine-phosphatase